MLDTEVYSNTGGQASKATPPGAVAKFAAGGKRGRKKDPGLIAMSYGNIYVASIAMGAKEEHTLKVFLEAEADDGPALIIAYRHCIAHRIDMTDGLQHQRAAVESGQWLLYRYNPDLAAGGQNPWYSKRRPRAFRWRSTSSWRTASRCWRIRSQGSPGNCSPPPKPRWTSAGNSTSTWRRGPSRPRLRRIDMCGSLRWFLRGQRSAG